MNKFIRILIFLFIYFSHLQHSHAFSSSSYLISQIAFNKYDFTKVLSEFSLSKDSIKNLKYSDELISSVIMNDYSLSEKIAEEILLNNPKNQEAILIKLVNYIKYNKISEFNNFFENNIEEDNQLVQFIFFNNNKLKNKVDISNSLIEVVRSSYANEEKNYHINYNFFLFYTTLAILVNPNNDEALFFKAQFFQLIENYVLAETNYSKIKKSSMYYQDAQRNIAFNYSKFNKFLIAEKKIKTLIELNNNNYFLKRILADFYRVEKRYNLAITTYDDLITTKENDLWYVYYLRGICYERTNQWSLAEKDFLSSLNLEPNQPNVLNYLAYGWLERDMNIEKSLKMLKEAYSKNPNSHHILDSLAWAHFKKNNYKEAAKLMEKVIDMAPGEAISLDHLGDIYFALNRKREAKYFWIQAKDLAEPEDEIMEEINIKLNKFNAG